MRSIRDFIGMFEGDMLLEDRIETVRQIMVPKIVAKWQPISNPPTVDFDERRFWKWYIDMPAEKILALSNKIFEACLQADPTPKKIYTQWICQTWLTGGVKGEDIYKLHDQLTIYETVKPKLPAELRDINRFKTPKQLSAALAPFKVQGRRMVDAKLDAAMRKEATVVYESGDYEILIPKTKEAAIFFGQGTQWCTSDKRPEHNRFDDYTKLGYLYIITHKPTGDRFQWHEKTRQFMDEEDEPVHLEWFFTTHHEPTLFLFGEYHGTIEREISAVLKRATLEEHIFCDTDEKAKKLGRSREVFTWRLEGDGFGFSASQDGPYKGIRFYVTKDKKFKEFYNEGSNRLKDYLGTPEFFIEMANRVGVWGNDPALAKQGVVCLEDIYVPADEIGEPYLPTGRERGKNDMIWKLADAGDMKVYTLHGKSRWPGVTNWDGDETPSATTDDPIIRITVSNGYLAAKWLNSNAAEGLGRPVYDLLMRLDPTLKPKGPFYPWYRATEENSVIADIFPASKDAQGYAFSSRWWRFQLVKERPQWGNEKDHKELEADEWIDD